MQHKNQSFDSVASPADSRGFTFVKNIDIRREKPRPFAGDGRDFSDLINPKKRRFAGLPERSQVSLDDDPYLVERNAVVFMPERIAQSTYLRPRLLRRQFLSDRTKLYRRFIDPQEAKENGVLNDPPFKKLGLG